MLYRSAVGFVGSAWQWLGLWLGDGTTKSVLLRQVNLYSSVRLRFRWEAQLSLYFFALTPQLDLAPGQDILSAQQV